LRSGKTGWQAPRTPPACPKKLRLISHLLDSSKREERRNQQAEAVGSSSVHTARSIILLALEVSPHPEANLAMDVQYCLHDLRPNLANNGLFDQKTDGSQTLRTPLSHINLSRYARA
jgi:hypothetical protein